MLHFVKLKYFYGSLHLVGSPEFTDVRLELHAVRTSLLVKPSH